MKPFNKVKIKWSPEFAYAIGLLTTDGNLSKDGRHMNFTSKDFELVKIFKKCLNLDNKIGRKSRERFKDKKYFQVQFGDVIYYSFLISIGLMPKKSKIMSAIKISDKYFFDFLRGHFDGDGSFFSYWDPRWKSSFMFYTVFISASKKHIDWIRNRLFLYLKIWGHISRDSKKLVYQLKYAKAESLKLLPKIYYNNSIICLTRKRLKIIEALEINSKHARVEKLADSHL